MLAAAAERSVVMRESHCDAIAGARIIVSAVTATSSTDVAREAAASLAPGQIFADINSVSPGTKRANAKLIEDAGGHYVDVAVMVGVLSEEGKSASSPLASSATGVFNADEPLPEVITRQSTTKNKNPAPMRVSFFSL
jgi:3-hydroxyisobutyrate dehydrogenase-like beta-hydroxyacid dehydrogenase